MMANPKHLALLKDTSHAAGNLMLEVNDLKEKGMKVLKGKTVTFRKFKRGSMDKELRRGIITGWYYNSTGWVNVRIFRKDGTLGEFAHGVDIDDIIAVGA